MRASRIVQIGNSKFRVYIVDEGHPGLEGNVGLCDLERQIIWIKRDSQDRMLDTYVHELIHAFFEVYRLPVTVGFPQKPAFEERLISTMTPLLLATFSSAGLLNRRFRLT